MSIEITNVREVNGWIGLKLKGYVKELPKLLASTAMVIMDAAKRRAPVITGRYRSSLHIEGNNMPAFGTYKDDKGESFVGSFSEKPADGEYFVGTNVEYAGDVERNHKTLEEATVDGQWYLTRKINESNRK